MQLKKLSLTNFRAFKQAEFDFQPNMNLIVGINGVGKSTVLDALRVMYSCILPQISASKSPRLSFELSDITFEKDALLANLSFDAQGIDYIYDVYKPRQQFSTETRVEISDEEFSNQLSREDRIRLRREKYTGFSNIERDELTPPGNPAMKKSLEQPLVVFFSTRRSVQDGRAASKAASAGGQAAAFSEALSERDLRWREFADWWLVQQELGRETGKSFYGKNMEVLSETVERFLENIHGLRAISNPKPALLLEKNGATLEITQLSDGERGMISLVLDLAKRLAQANPKIPNPLDGNAVVLIDELDLHLHPRWQRDVVKKLIHTFPNCQFIATTHSPQIVGEVSPDNIIILEADKPPYRPDQSLGMDTNWILEFLMDTRSGNVQAEQELDDISDWIEDGLFEKAKTAIEQLRILRPRDPRLVRLQTRLERMQILGQDEIK